MNVLQLLGVPLSVTLPISLLGSASLLWRSWLKTLIVREQYRDLRRRNRVAQGDLVSAEQPRDHVVGGRQRGAADDDLDLDPRVAVRSHEAANPNAATKPRPVRVPNVVSAQAE